MQSSCRNSIIMPPKCREIFKLFVNSISENLCTWEDNKFYLNFPKKVKLVHINFAVQLRQEEKKFFFYFHCYTRFHKFYSSNVFRDVNHGFIQFQSDKKKIFSANLNIYIYTSLHSSLILSIAFDGINSKRLNQFQCKLAGIRHIRAGFKHDRYSVTCARISAGRRLFADINPS